MQLEELFKAGEKNILYDTAFNSYSDRVAMREVACRYGYRTIVVWIDTPIKIAKERAIATIDPSTRVLGRMSEESFAELANKLELPKNDEISIRISGMTLSPAIIKKALELY